MNFPNFIARLVLIAGLVISVSSFAAEEVTIDYEYTGNHGVDFSKLSGSMKVGPFSDDRSSDNPQLITDKDLDTGNGGFVANHALTALIENAFEQGFVSGGAEIVDADSALGLSGKLLSSDAQLIERNGVEMIQLTMRVNVQVQKGGRNIWQVTLFGRGRTPVEDGIQASVKAALDRLVGELFLDDYFLQQVM